MHSARVILSWIMALMIVSTPPAWVWAAPMVMDGGTGMSLITSAPMHCNTLSKGLTRQVSPCRCCNDNHSCIDHTCQYGGCMAHASMFGLLQNHLPTVGLARERWAGPVRSTYPDRHPPPDIKPPQNPQ